MSKPAQPQQETARTVTKLIVMHGDKGGVGKSMVAQAVADHLMTSGQDIAIIEADTRNPDVARMYNKNVPCSQINVRAESGWMDAMDFVMKHAGSTIILNTPAGIGENMAEDIKSFAQFVSDQEVPVEMELWWVMNVQHDSVNLLADAFKSYGHYFKRVRVCCNLHFGDKNAFMLWNESPLKTQMEKKNGLTIFFPALHIRVVQKVLDATKMMPYSDAADVAAGEALHLEHSERWKLTQWIRDCQVAFEPAFKAAPAAGAAVAA